MIRGYYYLVYPGRFFFSLIFCYCIAKIQKHLKAILSALLCHEVLPSHYPLLKTQLGEGTLILL